MGSGLQRWQRSSLFVRRLRQDDRGTICIPFLKRDCPELAQTERCKRKRIQRLDRIKDDSQRA